MRIRQIDLPEELIQAQKAGTLVIFAGAGVSIDPPSNYPDFDNLAAKIGGTVHPRLPEETIDRYLGRLDSMGVTVHQQVQSMLSSPDSKPNKLHESVIALYRASDTLRLVTTNFDRHFSTSALQQFGTDCPEIFSAPALPVGNHFNGIVHLHGAVDKEADRLIVTDADFGRAYITEGWATQFLQRLFSKYVVLFIGYSHQDMLLNYLARGLTVGPGEPKRFVLTPPGDDARWKNLGIVPVHYPLSDPPKPRYCELGIALSAWAEQSHAGALAVEARIKSIVEGGVPLEAEDRDYLERSLSDISTLRFFTRHAKASEWLNWLEDQSVFNRLFSTSTVFAETDAELARWFVENFAIDRIDEALDVLRRKNLRASAVLWHMIALVLFQKKPGGTVVAKWVPVLLETLPTQLNGSLLEYLLSDCAKSDNAEPALLLLAYLTRPVVALKRSLRHVTDTDEYVHVPDIEVSTIADETWLGQSWASYFSSDLDRFGISLASMVTSNLMEAHRRFKCFGKGNENWDPISSSRGMIESRQQDHLHGGMSVLLDIAAGVMKWACESAPDLADGLIVQWIATTSPLLRRLATFGIAEAQHTTPDAKLDWLLEKELLYKFGIKHETFLLLASAYPHASEGVRIRLLDRVVKGRQPQIEDRDLANYEIFNVVVWLAQKAPDCEHTKKLLEQLKSDNPTFGAREHPDMDSWISSGYGFGWQSSVDKSDLLFYDLGQLEAALANSSSQVTPHGSSLDGLLRSIGESARDSINWGLTIASQARAQGQWSKDIWSPLIGAWVSSDLTEEQWKTALDLLCEAKALHESEMYNISSLLERGVQNSNAPIPIHLLGEAKALADQILPYCRILVDKERPGATDNWMGPAINHPAGYLTEFYLRALSKLRDPNEPDPVLSAQYLEVFTSLVDGQTYADELARVILASTLHFLYSIDVRWTVEKMFPLFDPTTDIHRARQCWHGYLSQGRWTDPMLTDLLKYYELWFSLIKDEPDSIENAFCSHLAGIAIYSLIHPLESGWLLRFLSQTTAAIRTTWATQMRMLMKNLDDDAKTHLWTRWLKNYWEGRLKGSPLPLDARESAGMLEWVLELGPVLPQVVDLVCQSPYPNLGHFMAYYPIAKSELLKQHPSAVAKLLAFLAAGEHDRPIYDLHELRNAVEQLIDLIPGDRILRGLCDDLARLGVLNVADLVARLTS